MTFPAAYYVTADGRADPYRVVLTVSTEGWTATVERENEVWTFPIRDAGGGGRVWVGETLLAFGWSDGRLVVDGVEHPLRVESETRHRAGRMRSLSPGGRRTSEVRAPMPGLIVAVLVEEGARVETGSGLAVIEAMKMENEILAPASGTVREIGVRTGQAIEKDVLICRIEPGEPA
jgi:biotin carboxyl carrier protein